MEANPQELVQAAIEAQKGSSQLSPFGYSGSLHSGRTAQARKKMRLSFSALTHTVA